MCHDVTFPVPHACNKYSASDDVVAIIYKQSLPGLHQYVLSASPVNRDHCGRSLQCMTRDTIPHFTGRFTNAVDDLYVVMVTYFR